MTNVIIAVLRRNCTKAQQEIKKKYISNGKINSAFLNKL